jgi:uncharacterized membrane protein YbhN (UPF0104 family)
MNHATEDSTPRFRQRGAKRWLRLALQLLSLALFGLILWSGGVEPWEQIMHSASEDVLVAFLLVGAATVLSATRLQIMVHSMVGRELAPWSHYYYLNMTARALGLVVPRSLSNLGGKSVALRALGVSLKRAVWLVMVDNLLDLLLLGVLVIPGLVFLRGAITLGGFAGLVFGLTLALVGALWWAATAGRWLPFTKTLTRIPWLGSVLRVDPEEADNVLPSRSTVLQALGLTALLNGALAVGFYYMALAVGVTSPWFIFAAGFPITQLSLVISVTPGGLGLFDAGWYGVLLLGGVSRGEALTFVVAQRAYLSVFVLVWAGVSTLLSLTTRKGNGAW